MDLGPLWDRLLAVGAHHCNRAGGEPSAVDNPPPGGSMIIGVLYHMTQTRKRTPLIQRILSKIAIDQATGCWNFMGSRTRAGYGRVGDPDHIVHLAYRITYEHFKGPRTQGLALHHLCHNKPCVNPQHLTELPVQAHNATHAIDRRTTHCPKGHLKTLRTKQTKGLRCAVCLRVAVKRWMQQNKERANTTRREWRAKRREQGLPPS